MPFPGEHSCRIQNPGEFTEGGLREGKTFARGKRGRLEFILGRLKGATGTSVQAFRYPKDQWTAEEARRHCEGEHGMRFEPAQEGATPSQDEPNPQFTVDQEDQRPPKEWWTNCITRAQGFADDPEAFCGGLWHNPGQFPGGGSKLREAFGRDMPTQDAPLVAHDHTQMEFQADAIRLSSDGQWAIIPTIATKEGVQNRSLKRAGDLREAMGRRGFEGIPLVDGHPPRPPGFVTRPDQIRGHFRDATLLDPGAAVQGNTWLFIGDEPGRRLLQDIKEGKKRSVSLGFFHDTIKTPGVFQGQAYDNIQTHILPDHLSIEPVGACSREQGCGLLLP